MSMLFVSVLITKHWENLLVKSYFFNKKFILDIIINIDISVR